jgi:mycothiol synthase
VTNQEYEITAARPDEWSAAFELALAQVPEAERPGRVLNALTLLSAGEIDPQGIIVARTPAELAGVQVCLPLAGKSGLFWLPQVEAAWRASELGERLVRAAVAWVRQRGAKLAQAILPANDVARAGPLLRSGFRHITQLHYLRHHLVDIAPLPVMPAMRLQPWTPDLEPVFHETLLHTYEGTLDCPELNGVRTIEEIIAGHRAQGIWRPERWWLAFQDNQPAGVGLLTELFDQGGWDLSYVGVVPPMRQRGLGRALTVHALHAAQEAGTLQLMVAVDKRNAAALQMYQSLGFELTESREVLLLVFQSDIYK